MDTTSLSFYGAGGGTLGRRGHSKDHRPELAQMILAVVIGAQGRPICTEMVPGNTADVKVLLTIVRRLRTRFGITRSCVVADRGMISADTIAALEELDMEYILGARERTSSVIRDVVLNDTTLMVPLVLERQAAETQLWVKEVRVGEGRDPGGRGNMLGQQVCMSPEAIPRSIDLETMAWSNMRSSSAVVTTGLPKFSPHSVTCLAFYTQQGALAGYRIGKKNLPPRSKCFLQVRTVQFAGFIAEPFSDTIDKIAENAGERGGIDVA
ncbi:transposase, partial [Sphingobium sp. 3R8]|uniref:IS1634 family transposase n=1 Tax=Sphingobium sp. 3R8 TaxID=2874921 RepID=UPI002961F619